MIKLHKLIATTAGIGYIGKGGGTVAAIAFCLLWILLPASYVHSYWQVLIVLFVTAIGVWSSNKVESLWGKDSSKVVIDEVAGMAITLLLVPHNIWFMLVSLAAFRFFDIVKPLGIRSMEKLPKGWGVMADDVLSGVYAWLLVQGIIYASGQIL